MSMLRHCDRCGSSESECVGVCSVDLCEDCQREFYGWCAYKPTRTRRHFPASSGMSLDTSVALEAIEKLADQNGEFDLSTLARVVGTSNQLARYRVRWMVSKGRLSRVRRGVYRLADTRG